MSESLLNGHKVSLWGEEQSFEDGDQGWLYANTNAFNAVKLCTQNG